MLRPPLTEAASRRDFLRRGALLGAALLAGPSRSVARPASRNGDPLVRVAHIADTSAAGASAARGAQLGAAEAVRAMELLGRRFEMVSARAAGADEVVDAARSLAGGAPLAAIIGGFDEAGAQRLAELAETLGALFLNVGAASDALRAEGCRRTTFHIAASEAMRRDAGAVAGLPADGGSGPASRVELWHATLERYGAGQLNDRFRARFDHPPDSSAWASWMAVKVVWEACARTRSVEVDTVVRHLVSDRARFDGHKGMPLSFRSWDHQLRQPLYLVQDDRVVAEVPRGGPDERRGWTGLLDQLGTPANRSGCRLPQGDG